MHRRWENCREEIKSINKAILKNSEGVFMAVMLMTALVAVTMLYKRWLCDICYVDVFAIYSYERQRVIIPFAVMAVMFFIKNDFSRNRIVRYTKVRSVWLATVRKISVISIYLTGVITVTAGLCGKLFSYCEFNWNQPYTYFWQMTGGSVVESVFYPLILLVFFISMFFSICICAVGEYLMFWLTGSHIAGILAVLAICLTSEETGIFHKYFSADFTIWTDNINWFKQLVVPMVILALLVFAGWLFVKNKEFGVKKKRRLICGRAG
ncbi:MAG: hypothetical protein ACLRVQ_03980 [Lachnospiraceae bacterium]